MNKILVISNNIFLRNLLTNQENIEFVFADEESLRNLDLQEFEIVLIDTKISNQKFYDNLKIKNLTVISFDENDKTKISNIHILSKPIQIMNLLALIKEILIEKELEILNFEDFILDRKKRLVIKNGEFIRLTELETKLIQFLFEKNKKYSKKELLSNVWGYKNLDTDTSVVETAIAALRKKLNELKIIF